MCEGHVLARKVSSPPTNPPDRGCVLATRKKILILLRTGAYRSMLYKTPGLSQYISGVILHWETLFQSDADGNKMVDLITKAGMIPGIKLTRRAACLCVCGCGGDCGDSVLCACVCFRLPPRRLCLECGPRH